MVHIKLPLIVQKYGAHQLRAVVYPMTYTSQVAVWDFQLRWRAVPDFPSKDFPSKALEEEALGGFNLLPSTGPVATWMGRCLSSRLA